MSAVSKRDLVVTIAYKLGVKQEVVLNVVDEFMRRIVDELTHGRRIELRDFAVFEPVTRKPKVGRNPKTGELVPIPARRSVKFKMGRILRQRLRVQLPAALVGTPAQ